MKKTSILFFFASLLFAACNKGDKEVVVPTTTVSTLSKSSKPDEMLVPPKTSFVFGDYVYHVGTDNKGTTKISLFITASFGVDKIKDVVLTMKNKDSVDVIVPASNSYVSNNPSITFLQPLVLDPGDYVISYKGSILDPTVVGELKTRLEVSTVSSAIPLKADGQVMTFIVPKMVTVTDQNNPSGVVAANQVVNTLNFTATAMGTALPVPSVDVRVEDMTLVQEIKILQGTAVVGTKSFSGVSGAQTLTIPVTGVNLAKDDSKSFTVQLNLKPITAASQSESNIKTTLVKLNYQLPNGDVRSTTTQHAGNDILVYKTILSGQRVAVSSLIDTTQKQDLYRLDITADPKGDGSIKSVAYDVLLNDITSGANEDTIRISDLEMRYGGVAVTNGTFTNANGQPITVITESDTKIYFTFTSGTQKAVIPAGTTVPFVLRGRLSGLKHAGDGDNVVIKLATDATPAPSGFRYVNRGTSGSNAKLHSSPFPSSGAVNANIILSDNSDPNSQSIFGASTADHFNSARFSFPTSQQVLYQ
jgi:hypothetical protein